MYIIEESIEKFKEDRYVLLISEKHFYDLVDKVSNHNIRVLTYNGEKYLYDLSYFYNMYPDAERILELEKKLKQHIKIHNRIKIIDSI